MTVAARMPARAGTAAAQPAYCTKNKGIPDIIQNAFVGIGHSLHLSPLQVNSFSENSFGRIEISAPDNLIITPGSQQIHQHIYQPEAQETASCDPDKQPHIMKAEKLKQPVDHRKSKGCVDPRPDQRHEKHRKDLGINTFPDLLFSHAHLLEDFKSVLIFIAF